MLTLEAPAGPVALLAVVDFTGFARLSSVAEANPAILALIGRRVASQAMPLAWSALTSVASRTEALLAAMPANLVLKAFAILAAVLALQACAIDGEAPAGLTPIAATLRLAVASRMGAPNTGVVLGVAVALLALPAVRHVRVAAFAVRRPASGALAMGVDAEALHAALDITRCDVLAVEAVLRARFTMASCSEVEPAAARVASPCTLR